MNEPETDLVSRGYLTTLFIDMDNLKNGLTGYRGMILRYSSIINTSDNRDKKFEESIKAIKDEKMKDAIVSWCDNIRHNVERCHISIDALSDSIIEIKEDAPNLTDLYEKIVNSFAPNLADVKEYTFQINKTFIRGTLEKHLNKMETFYNQFTK